MLRPVAKELVRTGLVMYDQTARVVTELVDGLNSLVDEARADLKKEPTEKTSKTPPSDDR